MFSLFDSFEDHELPSDIKPLQLDGRDAAVAMAMVWSPLFFPHYLFSDFLYTLPIFISLSRFNLPFLTLCRPLARFPHLSPPRTCSQTCLEHLWTNGNSDNKPEDEEHKETEHKTN
ncbi:hypothetical protein ILYODFUR_030679 [Ilyodon furcidens]|uniref:Uncharacterized protein n=1 Tax=Ilyodon furcidens TaxID=33524 RepID=A0ABV0UKW4_9TELE